MTVTVAAAILRRKNRILIARRAGDRIRGGLWELPGGKVDDGESPEGALVREIREELGIEIRVGRCAGAFLHDYQDLSIELLCYECTISRGTPKTNPADHDALKWVLPGELLRHRFTDADLPVIELLHRP